MSKENGACDTPVAGEAGYCCLAYGHRGPCMTGAQQFPWSEERAQLQELCAVALDDNTQVAALLPREGKLRWVIETNYTTPKMLIADITAADAATLIAARVEVPALIALVNVAGAE